MATDGPRVSPEGRATVGAMTRSLLADAFGHHVWATLALIDACLPLSGEQLDTAVPGTYGSILETMRHLVGADASYLFVLSDGRYPEIDEATMDLAALRAAMEADGVGWRALLAQDLDPDEYDGLGIGAATEIPGGAGL